ncbi:hypothetical protein MRX96_000552 [Rhipicephalus microplus]
MISLDSIEEIFGNDRRDNRDSGDAVARDRPVAVDERAPLVHRSPTSCDSSWDLPGACIVLFMLEALIVLVEFITLWDGADSRSLNSTVALVICVLSIATIGAACGAVFYWLYTRRPTTNGAESNVSSV